MEQQDVQGVQEWRVWGLERALGWARAELARRMGVSQALVSRVRRGGRRRGRRFRLGAGLAFPGFSAAELLAAPDPEAA